MKFKFITVQILFIKVKVTTQGQDHRCRVYPIDGGVTKWSGQWMSDWQSQRNPAAISPWPSNTPARLTCFDGDEVIDFWLFHGWIPVSEPGRSRRRCVVGCSHCLSMSALVCLSLLHETTTNYELTALHTVQLWHTVQPACFNEQHMNDEVNIHRTSELLTLSAMLSECRTSNTTSALLWRFIATLITPMAVTARCREVRAGDTLSWILSLLGMQSAANDAGW